MGIYSKWMFFRKISSSSQDVIAVSIFQVLQSIPFLYVIVAIIVGSDVPWSFWWIFCSSNQN